MICLASTVANQKTSGSNIELILSIIAIIISLMAIAFEFLGNQRINRINLEAKFYENIYEEFATSADFVCLMGLIYLRNGLVLKAMAEFLKATTFKTSHVEGANTFIPTFNMGCINEVVGDIDAAVRYYKKCGDFKPALDRLEALNIT